MSGETRYLRPRVAFKCARTCSWGDRSDCASWGTIGGIPSGSSVLRSWEGESEGKGRLKPAMVACFAGFTGAVKPAMVAGFAGFITGNGCRFSLRSKTGNGCRLCRFSKRSWYRFEWLRPRASKHSRICRSSRVRNRYRQLRSLCRAFLANVGRFTLHSPASLDSSARAMRSRIVLASPYPACQTFVSNLLLMPSPF